MCSLDTVWACYKEDEELMGWKSLKKAHSPFSLVKLSFSYLKTPHQAPQAPNKVGRRNVKK
jgi:hypothetical protein